MISLNLIGLIYSAAGAAIFARGHAFAQTPAHLQFAAGQIHPQAMFEQRVDARIGLGLIVAGFAIQVLGQIGALGTGSLNMLFLSALVMIGLYYLLMRDLLAEQDAAAVLPEAPQRLEPALLENASQPLAALPTLAPVPAPTKRKRVRQ